MPRRPRARFETNDDPGLSHNPPALNYLRVFADKQVEMSIYRRPGRPDPGRMGARGILLLAAALTVLCNPQLVTADSSTNAPRDSLDLSLDQLINIQVISVSKKETSVENSPAAISVITSDDISRLGLTSVPEALRLVPGMDVAQIDSHQWAISVRGFDSEFADKLLVLVDGRSVYTQASGGVFWDAQTMMMDDVDRIEVVRGPGATLWGANAVDGVINIVSKSAKDTQGLLLTGEGGSEIEPLVGARYGGTLASDLYYRVYLQQSDYADYPEMSGQSAGDFWNTTLGGLRLDWEPPSQNTFMFEANAYKDDAATPTPLVTLVPPSTSNVTNVEANSGANALGRWTHNFSTSQLTAQACFDHIQQGDGFDMFYQNSYDVDLQYQFALGSWNDFVAGTGYQNTSLGVQPSFNATLNPETTYVRIFNMFVQDDITIVPDKLHLTLGSKLEYDNLVGWEPEPSARLMWTPTSKQAVWAAVSRATATPPLYELEARVNYFAVPTGAPPHPPLLAAFLPNSELDPEKLLSYELGYRIEPAKVLSVDATAFYNSYQGLGVPVANAPELVTSPTPYILNSSTWQDVGNAQTLGAEASIQWRPADNVRLVGSYSWLHENFASMVRANDGQDPIQQFQLRSYIDLTTRLQLNSAFFYVDRRYEPSPTGTSRIPAYFNADVGLVWKMSKAVELGLWGENLIQNTHSEFPDLGTPVQVEIPRSVLAKLTLRL